MSTIAYRDGVLAVDRMATFGDVGHVESGKLEYFSKIQTVIASSGDMVVVKGLFDHIHSNIKKHKSMGLEKEGYEPDPWVIADKEYFAAFVLQKRSGNLYLDFLRCNISAPWDPTKYHAIGNGHQLAIGAMWQGATAVEAVQAACEHSVFSGYGVIYVDMNETKPTVTICPPRKDEHSDC